MGASVPDMVDTLEGGDDFFIMGDHNDSGLVLPRHPVENADNRQRPLAVGSLALAGLAGLAAYALADHAGTGGSDPQEWADWAYDLVTRSLAHVIETDHTWDFLDDADQRFRPQPFESDANPGVPYWVIDGGQPPDTVSEAVWECVAPLL